MVKIEIELDLEKLNEIATKEAEGYYLRYFTNRVNSLFREELEKLTKDKAVQLMEDYLSRLKDSEA